MKVGERGAALERCFTRCENLASIQALVAARSLPCTQGAADPDAPSGASTAAPVIEVSVLVQLMAI